MTLWQPVITFQFFGSGHKEYKCTEVFRDPDEALQHAQNVAKRFSDDEETEDKELFLCNIEPLAYDE